MTLTYLVQGGDASLRDRAVQRLVDELLEGQDRTLALEDHALTDDDTEAFAAVTNALQSPPFMTAYRVVVVRDIGQASTEQAQWLAGWIAEPLDSARLVLVVGEGRTPAPIDKAVKAHGEVVKPVTEKTADLLSGELKGAKVKLAPAASQAVVDHFGEDAGRVPELVALLGSTYGEGATLDLADVEVYLGDVGTAGNFDLTNAIDKGDVAGALDTLNRMLSATSAQQQKPVHPMQIMGMLSSSYRKLLRLDDPAIVTKEQAALALDMKSVAGARFRLDAAKRLGTPGLKEAIDLLARAELDLRGEGGLDERTVIEVLVARLAALTRRNSPSRRRA